MQETTVRNAKVIAEGQKKAEIIRSIGDVKTYLEKMGAEYNEVAGEEYDFLRVPLSGLYPKTAMLSFGKDGAIQGAVVDRAITLQCTGIIANSRKTEPLNKFQGSEVWLTMVRNGVIIGSLILADKEYSAFAEENDFLI